MAKKNESLAVAALEMIAGERQCINNLLSDKAIAREALAIIRAENLREDLEHPVVKDSLTAQEQPAELARQDVCNWRQPSYDHVEANYWDTDCGESWAITEGKPSENGMRFCHGCGKPIKEHPFVDSEDEQ